MRTTLLMCITLILSFPLYGQDDSGTINTVYDYRVVKFAEGGQVGGAGVEHDERAGTYHATWNLYYQQYSFNEMRFRILQRHPSFPNPDTYYTVLGPTSPYNGSGSYTLPASNIVLFYYEYYSGFPPTGHFRGTFSSDGPPAAPTNLSVSNSGGHPYLTWSAVSNDAGFSHYKIYRSLSGQGGYYRSIGTTTSTSYTDTEIDVVVKNPPNYAYYKVTAVDNSSPAHESGYSNVGSIGTNAAEGHRRLAILQTPREYSLGSNFPNPFNPVTEIPYQLPEDGDVKLVVYDPLGRSIRVLVDQYQNAGRYTVIWDGKNEEGEEVSSGTYFHRISVLSGGELKFAGMRKMILLR